MIPWLDSLDDLEHFAAAVAGPDGLGIETTSYHVWGKGFFLYISPRISH